MKAFILLALGLALGTFALFGQDGAASFQTHCAGCHDAPVGRVPPTSALRAKPAGVILSALRDGVMKAQAAGLSEAERSAVAAYLARPELEKASVPNACSTGQPSADLSTAAWSSWGADASNTRFQSSEAAGITATQVPTLKLKWAFNLGAGVLPRSQPAVAGGRIFVGADGGNLYALDARSGCTHWVFQADDVVRSGIVVGQSAVFFGDQKGNVYAVGAESGKLVWKTHADGHFAAVITGTPALHDGVLYAGVSSYEEVMAADPKYACCTFRGSVIALNASTGARLWQRYTVNADPKNPRGPSGAAVWSTPTFDEKKKRVYVATGDNYSTPSTETSDAVLAMDAASGKLLWSRQVTPGDIYNVGCDVGVEANCPTTHGRDFDFGQPPMLVELGGGRRALVIGQKSGFVYGFDPDKDGAELWRKQIGKGGALGGSQWGSAADRDRVYAAVSDLRTRPVADSKAPHGFRMEVDAKHGGGLFALNAASGQVVWSAAAPSCGDKKQCSPAQSAPVSAIPGVVFSGSVDGHLRGYAAATGAVIWDMDTVGEYAAVNGGTARGGSIDVTGPVIAGGMVYTTSGYGQWGGMPGNVLLAYSVEGR